MMRQGATDNELDMARSNMAAMRAQYELAKIQYENASVTAPVSGIVVDVMIDEGNMVGTGTPLAAIVVDDPIYVEVRMPEQYYGRIRPRIDDIGVRVSSHCLSGSRSLPRERRVHKLGDRPLFENLYHRSCRGEPR